MPYDESGACKIWCALSVSGSGGECIILPVLDCISCFSARDVLVFKGDGEETGEEKKGKAGAGVPDGNALCVNSFVSRIFH